MSVSREEVQKIVELSKLQFSENELEKFTKDLSNIVDFADKLAKLDVEGVKPTAHILDIQNVFKEDNVKPSYKREEILKNAPSAQGGCISVPKVVE